MRSRRPISRAAGPSWYVGPGHVNGAALNSRAKIAQAMDETRQKIREAKTAEEQHNAALTLEALRDERRRHEQIIQKGVRTRRENKRAARFKRMGGQGEFSPLRLGSLFDSFVKKADEDDRLQERGRLRRREHLPEEALVQATPQSNECFATQYRRSTSMLPPRSPSGRGSGARAESEPNSLPPISCWSLDNCCGTSPVRTTR
jgi:hypothetical protein